MKFLALFLISFAFVQFVNSTGCAKKLGVDPALLTRVKAGDYNFEDQKMKEFFFCMFKELGFTDDDKKIHRDVIMSTTTDENRDLVKAAVDACEGTEGKDLNEFSWNWAKCYSKQYPEDVFIYE